MILRLALLIAAASTSLLAQGNGYGFSVAVTINHALISATLTNYPLTYAGTWAELKSIANGGKVNSANDIIFASDQTCGSVLPFQRVYWSASSGAAEFHVLVASVSSTVDTTVYRCYGRAGDSDHSASTTVWAGFLRVYHWGNGSSLDLSDSTSNAANATIPGDGGSPTYTAGVVGPGALDAWVAGFGQHYITASDAGLPSGSSDRTISTWYLKPTATWSDGYIWSLGNFATPNQCFSLRVSDSGTTVKLYDGVVNTFNFTFTAGTWYHIVVTFTSATKTGEVWINGTSIGTWVNNSQNTTLIGTFYVIETNPAVYNGNAQCYLDELRVRSTVQSPASIAADYASQKPSQNLWSDGAEVAGGGGSGLAMRGVGD